MSRPIALFLLPPLSVLAACSDPGHPTAPAAVRPAYVVEARSGDAVRTAFVGEVRAARRAELAFATSGRVASVHVEVGDRVRAGQPLARLDDTPAKAQLDVASADAARADAQLAEARQRLERVLAADRTGAASAAELGAVQAEAAAAATAVRSATAQRDLAAWTLANTVLRAPVDGVVAQRAVEPGQSAGPGAPVLTIDGAGRELVVLVPDSTTVEPGRTVVLRGESTTVEARVLRVAGRLEAAGVRKVFVSVPEDARVGSTWSVALDDGAARAPEVPLRAVLPDAQAGRGRVMRIAADGRTTEIVAVALGRPQGAWIEVTQGLSNGDRVVVAGAAAIVPGSAVRPVDLGAERR